MALVFKIKHEGTLRRWVVCEAINAEMFPVTLEQLHAKVRELFLFPPASVLLMTYIDKENDVVTLGDDHDLVDACLIQRLNPLRLEVQVLESKPNALNSSRRVSHTEDELNMEGLLKVLLPQATSKTMQYFLQRYAGLFDPSLPIATLIVNAQDAFNQFLASASMLCHIPGPSNEPACHHHPYKHPYGDVHCKSMPGGAEHASAKDVSGCPTFHPGVECDQCGGTLIQGPRYKSNKIIDFDLSSTYYDEKGNEGDHDKIEHPVCNCCYCPPCLKEGHKQFMGSPMCGRGLFANDLYGWTPEDAFLGHYDKHKKLDALFVKDVNIFDGTKLAPGTKFTKVWCMSNNGSVPWPQNTQLLHIDGDVLSLQEAVNLELPENGLASGQEVEVSVDLMTPQKPGVYYSVWCLVSPAGQKFGQEVSVTIQVVPQEEQSLVLQVLPKDREEKSIEVTSPTTVVATGSIGDFVRVIPPPSEGKAEMMVDSATGIRSHDVMDVKITENVPDPCQDSEKFSLVEKSVDLNDEEMMDNSGIEKYWQELKLQSLESMGFMDRELNTALLSKNDGNMQLTVDDLLMAAGWEGALQDLKEMGFTDRVANVKLLVEQNGSINATVKELVQKGKEKLQDF